VAVRLQRPAQQIRVALQVADHAIRADVADACEDADIAVADPDESAEDVDVVLSDRPIESAVPLIGVVSGNARESWPADVGAVVPADMDATTLAAVITVVAAGYALTVRKDVGGEDSGAWADPGDGADELSIDLSPRERQVLALLAEGASNKIIARALGITVHTAKFHVASVTEKLGAHNRLEAVAIAIRAGLVMV
jgi:DNA-binding CsgD family transcriptional regulator